LIDRLNLVPFGTHTLFLTRTGHEAGINRNLIYRFRQLVTRGRSENRGRI
jgi:hypothetical protein